jgi:UDP-hydrolysing UDP-N-acetyl-D-glucosamine 2-epimerase
VIVNFISTSRADRGPLRAVYEETAQVDPRVRWWGGGAYEVPDLAVVLGDRFELLRIVADLAISGVVVAHIDGGDVTIGSRDDSYRHAITKLSHLHFPATREAELRILQMGEEPWRVHMLGSASVSAIMREPAAPRGEALRSTGLFDGPFSLMCLHPSSTGRIQEELSSAYSYASSLPESMQLVIIGPNEDEGCEQVRTFMSTLAQTRRGTCYAHRVSRRVFLSLLRHAEEFIGNSSAALYEAPSFGTKVIHIGNRQQGRSPVTCDGGAARRIAGMVLQKWDMSRLRNKKFCDVARGELQCAS